MSGIAVATLMILAGVAMIAAALVMRAARRKPSPLVDPAAVADATQVSQAPVQPALPLDSPPPSN